MNYPEGNSDDFFYITIWGKNGDFILSLELPRLLNTRAPRLANSIPLKNIKTGKWLFLQ